MTSIVELDQDLVTTVANATVSIGRDGRGSGIVVSEGFVLTNAHNLRDRTTEVGFADGRRVQGTVAGTDPDGDLAVLSVDTADTAPLTWADAAARVGQAVVAAAAGGGTSRVTVGHVAATGRAFRSGGGRLVEDAVEHTAPLARGSSGGPLVDLSGRLVGINTHRLGHRFYLARGAGADLTARIEQLRSGQSVRPRRLGIAIAPAHVAAQLREAVGLPARDGLLVRGVSEGSPAAAAGISEGDLLVEAGGSPVATVDDLAKAVDAAGATLTVKLVRGTEERTVEINLDTAEADAPEAESPDAG